MIDIFVCAAPTGTDGPGRVRVPAPRWASPLTSGAGITGGALHALQPVGGATDAVVTTTNAFTTLGNHPPGRPRS